MVTERASYHMALQTTRRKRWEVRPIDTHAQDEDLLKLILGIYLSMLSLYTISLLLIF